MWNEFKSFVARGNVFDMAVGIIIGASFGKIVSSLVTDVVMPPLGMILGKVDFANLYLNLSGGHFDSLADAKKAGAVTVNYGVFANNVLDFLIVAFVIFLLVRSVNRLKATPPSVPTSKDCPFCLSAIPLAAKKCGHCTSALV